MTEYDNTNRGSMFVNDRKETESHPDRTGSGCIECPNCGTKADFWLSGWLKTSKAGKKFLSLSFKPKDAPTQASAPPKPQRVEFEPDQDIPF